MIALIKQRSIIIAYQDGKTYWFISHSGTGRALSVYGNSQVSQTRNVIVWDNQSDSKVDFLTVNADENLYKIKLLNYNLLMTATGSANGADVRWQAPNGASSQVWRLVDVDGGGGVTPPSGGEIDMPVNINQKYQYNTQGVKNTGCALCCGVDIASWKHKKIYSIADFAGHYVEGIDSITKQPYASYNWTVPNKFSMRYESLASLNEAQTIDKIRYYVNQKIPVACHAVGSGDRQHWFVAYYAPAGGNTWNTCGILVLDTYITAENPMGTRIPIWQAMTISSVTWGIDSIRIPN